MGLTLALLLLAVVSACGGKSTTKTVQGGSSSTTAPAGTTTSGGAPTTRPGTTTNGGKGKLKLTASGAYSGTVDDSLTFDDCKNLGNTYRLQGKTTISGHTIELRLEVNGARGANGSFSPYAGPGVYKLNDGDNAVAGHFEDQTTRVRWADGPGAIGTVTTTSDTAGSFDLQMVSVPYKSTEPAPAASKVHLVGSWTC